MGSERRSFLSKVFWTSCGAISAIVGVPVVWAFLAPAKRKTVTEDTEARDLAKLAELRIGVPRKVDVIAARTDAWDRSEPQPVGAIWLIRRAERIVDGYSAVCPHLGCLLDFDDAKQVFTCPCHESAFSLVDGTRLAGPSPRGMDPLVVDVTVDAVRCSYKRFVLGISSRREA
jgi:Rieske Fe-S protein